MKVVRKLKTPLIRDNGIECTKEIISNDELRIPLSELSEFDGMILEPLPITEAQSVFFATQARTFWLVSYLPRNVLQFACERCGAAHFAYILHDKDVTPDFELKKPHFHVLLHFPDRCYMNSLIYWFRCTECRVVSTENVSKEWNYLTHNSDECRKQNKVPYPESDIVSNDFTYWRGRCFPTDDNNVPLDMYDDFCKGLSGRDMIKKYGFKFLTYVKVLDFVRMNCPLSSPTSEQKQVAFVVSNHVITNNAELEKVVK